MTELATVIDRLGGLRGLVDGAVPPLLFAATNAGAAALGHEDRAIPYAVVAAGGSALTLSIVRRSQGSSLAGVLRGLLVLAAAAGLALWTGQARDFFLPGIYVDAVYAVALAGSALAGYPVIGYGYAILFRAGKAWRHDPRLRRVLSLATWGWAAIYAVRAGAQIASYRADEPGLLAVTKLALGWPLTVAAVVLTLRAVHPGAHTGVDRASTVPGKPATPPSSCGSNWSASSKRTERRHVRTSGVGGTG